MSKKEKSEMVFEKIAGLIAERTGGDAAEISAGTTFEELGIDSLDTVEIAMLLEEELGVEIEMDSTLATVGDFAKYVESLVI